jgi:hypothetical protein
MWGSNPEIGKLLHHKSGNIGQFIQLVFFIICVKSLLFDRICVGGLLDNELWFDKRGAAAISYPSCGWDM